MMARKSSFISLQVMILYVLKSMSLKTIKCYQTVSKHLFFSWLVTSESMIILLLELSFGFQSLIAFCLIHYQLFSLDSLNWFQFYRILHNHFFSLGYFFFDHLDYDWNYFPVHTSPGFFDCYRHCYLKIKENMINQWFGNRSWNEIKSKQKNKIICNKLTLTTKSTWQLTILSHVIVVSQIQTQFGEVMAIGRNISAF